MVSAIFNTSEEAARSRMSWIAMLDLNSNLLTRAVSSAGDDILTGQLKLFLLRLISAGDGFFHLEFFKCGL